MKKLQLDLQAAARAQAADVPEWGHDRLETVGASEIGQCIRKIAMKKQGVDRDPGYDDDPGFAARGNVMEDHFSVPMLARAVKAVGGKLLYAGQANQTTIISRKLRLSATPDGLMTRLPRTALAKYGVKSIGASGEVLAEIKSIDPRVSKANLPKPEHIEQVIQGMGLLKHSGKHNPDWSLLFYVNASTFTEVDAFPIRFQDERFAYHVDRAKKIYSVPWSKQPLEGKLRFGGKPCRYCEFANKCGVAKKPTPKKGK